VFNVDHTILNRGTVGAGASATRFYLAVSPTATARFQVGEVAMPALAPSYSAVANATIFAPWTTPAGTYYLLACADGAVAVAESDETNNCLASSTTIALASVF